MIFLLTWGITIYRLNFDIVLQYKVYRYVSIFIIYQVHVYFAGWFFFFIKLHHIMRLCNVALLPVAV